MDIDAAARRHGVRDDDMIHAVLHHWRGYESDDPAVTMVVGPSTSGQPLEVGVVSDEDGTAIIHDMPAREKFLRGWWAAMTTSRAEHAAALDHWADRVEPASLRLADTASLRHIVELVERRDRIDDELTEAVRRARADRRSWSEIGAMLGVSKQAAQRKYGHRTTR